MSILHIVFNIEYTPEVTSPIEKWEFFHEDIPLEIRLNMVEVSNTLQFKTLLNHLTQDTECQIWVHLSKSAKTQHGKIGYVNEAHNFLQKNDIPYLDVTRSDEAANGDVVSANEMPEKSKNHSRTTVSELIKKIGKQDESKSKQSSESGPRPILVKTYKDVIPEFNAQFESFKKFIAKGIENTQQKNWWSILTLGPKSDEGAFDKLFNSKYWYFDFSVFELYLNITSSLPVLADSNLQVPSGILFNRDNKNWEVDFSFFDQVCQRFEADGSSYREKLTLALRLFLIHETIHKHHKLDLYTAENIGNFPRIVEYLDYQADAIAIVMESIYFIHENMESLKKDDLINAFLITIQTAVETTFSFNQNPGLKLIQVRRVNRYMIWLWLYTKIDLLKESQDSIESTYVEILELISRKPLIELSGPAIKSFDNRTFFNLEKLEFIEEVAYVKTNNQLVRRGVTSNFTYDALYEGFKKSSFSSLLKFFNQLEAQQ